MKRPIAISLSPNTEPDDIRRAWQAWHDPSIAADSKWILQVEKQLEGIFAGHAAALTSSGRQALYRLLKALNIGQGDEVIIQAFTCIAVPAAVVWTGAKPIYADIQADTYNVVPADVTRKIKPTTKAIVVQHTFGIPGPIEKLREIANDHNLFLIEDCAHGLGQSYQGQPLGTFGDAAILSFGRDKILSSVFGGAVVSHDQNLIERIREQQRALPYPTQKWVRQQLLHPYLLNIIIPWYFRAALGKLCLVLFQKLKLLSKAVEPEEKTGGKPDHIGFRFSPALAYLLMHQLDKLERYTARRREIVNRYSAVFGGARHALLRFPLQRENAAQIRISAKQSHILLGDWYNTPLAPPDSAFNRFGYTVGSCPVAEEVGRKILNLPTYPLLTDDQVEQVILFVQHHDKRG